MNFLNELCHNKNNIMIYSHHSRLLIAKFMSFASNYFKDSKYDSINMANGLLNLSTPADINYTRFINSVIKNHRLNSLLYKCDDNRQKVVANSRYSIFIDGDSNDTTFKKFDDASYNKLRLNYYDIPVIIRIIPGIDKNRYKLYKLNDVSRLEIIVSELDIRVIKLLDRLLFSNMDIVTLDYGLPLNTYLNVGY